MVLDPEATRWRRGEPAARISLPPNTDSVCAATGLPCMPATLKTPAKCKPLKRPPATAFRG